MIERCVRDAGGTYLCCDTDALIIVASKAGGTVQMPDGAAPVQALSWKAVEMIRRRFDSLSPYNRDIVPQLLRPTDENYDENGAQRQIFGLSIAAKRHALTQRNVVNRIAVIASASQLLIPRLTVQSFSPRARSGRMACRNGGGNCGVSF
jgi:hypothetical protein